jgi:hypothetical protein
VNQADRTNRIALWLLVIGVWGWLALALWRPGAATGTPAAKHREYAVIVCRGAPQLLQRMQAFDKNDAPKGWRVVGVTATPVILPVLGSTGLITATPRSDFILIIEREE